MLNIIKLFWNMFNGHKMDTGNFVTILALILHMIPDVSREEALNMATYIMMGGGQVLAIIGKIHRIIKTKQDAAKTSAPAAPVVK